MSELVPPPPPLPPPPLLLGIEVAVAGLVGEDRMKITVLVNVGDGVSVLRGVGVIVAVNVDVGWAAAVREEAALAVCAINVFTWFGSAVGNGAPNDGAHAMITARIANQNRNFLLRINIFPLPHSSVGMQGIRYFSTLIATYG